MFKTTIKKRVMQIINDKINTAQQEHDYHCQQVDEDAADSHRTVDETAADSKAQHLEQMVNSIIGKLI